MLASAKAWLVAGLCFIGVVFSAQSQTDLRTSENRQFEIVGLDTRSVLYVDELSRYVVEAAERYLDPEGLLFPQRILISLKPDEFVDFEGGYEIRVSEPALVSLDLRWNEETSLRFVFRAVAEALIVRYSIFNFGLGGLDALPEWPASAIGNEAYLRLRPGQFDNLIEVVDLDEELQLSAILERKWDAPVLDANGYAFLLSLRASRLAPSEMKAIFARALSGSEIERALEFLLLEGAEDAEFSTLDEWWQASLNEVVLPQQGSMETMEISREWIEELIDFSSSETGQFNLRTIWTHREDPEIRAMLEARYEILSIRLFRVNMAYFNSARSLGLLFESLLSEQRTHEYLNRLTTFLGDFGDAKQLEATLQRELSSTRR